MWLFSPMTLLRLLVAGLCGALLAPALALGQAPVPSSHSVRAEALGPATAPPSSAASHLRLHPPLPLDAGRLRAAKAAAAQRLAASRFGALSPTLGGPRSASVFSGLDQPGLSAADNRGDNQGAPSDSTGAIGPSHYVEIVNSKIAVYRRTSLSRINALDFDTFVGARGENVFDPQLLWDGSAGRWFYLTDHIRTSSGGGDGRDFLDFGWSKTADPTDLSAGWCHFRVDVDATFGGAAGSFFADYPKLGHDDSRLLFGTNLFNGSSAFLTANIWTVRKPANGDTSCAGTPTATPTGDPAHPLRTASGVRTFTPVPANVTDRSATGYVVAADSPLTTPSPNHLSVYPVSAGGSVGAPRNFAVAPFTTPGSAPQPGTVNTLDTLDSRLTQAVAHADPDAGGDKTIWTQHTIDGPGGRSVVRWYELLPDTSVVRQQGTVQDASTFAFNGAMSPAGDGNHAALFYNLSGPSQLPTLRAQSRSGPQPRGFLGPAVSLGTSNASLNDMSCSATAGSLTGPVCRWGDYAAATTDPSNALLVWGSSQLSGGALNPLAGGFQWVTRNFAVNTRDAAPRASFTSSPSRPRTRDRVRFDARGSSDPDGRVVRYRWNFGGRAGSTSATPSHVYGRVGRYRVTLTVTDDAGVSATVSRVITIADRPPSAVLQLLTRHPRAGPAVRFSGRRSRDLDGRVIAYRWSFGDRGSSRSSAPIHVFRRPGRYRVSLTVIDNSHRRTTTRRILTVGR